MLGRKIQCTGDKEEKNDRKTVFHGFQIGILRIHEKKIPVKDMENPAIGKA
jgi:hypothetical protein